MVATSEKRLRGGGFWGRPAGAQAYGNSTRAVKGAETHQAWILTTNTGIGLEYLGHQSAPSGSG